MSIEAMKRWLKALEYASTGNRRPELIAPAIAEMRQAIEQAEQAQPVAQPAEARACEVLSQGEWVLYPIQMAAEAIERGWPVRYLVPSQPEQVQPVAHPDEEAVDRFAAAMKVKMAKQRAKGYGGWDDPMACPTERLQNMLTDHIGKGDPVDVGNFAMMLFNRGEKTAPPPRQPLTDEEFISMVDSTGLVVDPILALEIKEMVEAAHGIKGDA
jgi:hypothetical protein